MLNYVVDTSMWCQPQGKSCMLVAGDVYRPAAIDQLVILGEQVLNTDFQKIALVPKGRVLD